MKINQVNNTQHLCVYTIVSTAVRSRVSTHPGAFVGMDTRKTTTFVGIFVYTRMSSTHVSTHAGTSWEHSRVRFYLFPALCFFEETRWLGVA